MTNVCATGIRPAETSVFLRAHWPETLAPAISGIEVYAASQMLNSAWIYAGTAATPAISNSVTIEIPHQRIPGFAARSAFFMLGADIDSDGDGLSDDYERIVLGTDPQNADTDGDGTEDGVETEQGTDPTDGSDTFPVRWVVLTGDLTEGEVAREIRRVAIPAGRACFAGVFVHSAEYPNWTGQASVYNDRLTWDVRAADNPTMSRTVQVNNEDVSWENSEGHSAFGMEPVVLKDSAIYVAGESDLVVTAELAAVNVSDGAYPSTVAVGFFPLNLVQANMPTATGGSGTTDAGGTYIRTAIPTNGIAYITGLPSPPQLTARIAGLPNWTEVTWGLSLTSERGDRRFDGIDDRILPSATLPGGESFDITARMGNEIVGGACALNVQAGGTQFIYNFSIRGKNPLDARARRYLETQVDTEFRNYAWMLAKHESRDGLRVYNQFNASGNRYAGLPNWGTPHGWGMSQIDKGRNGDTTAEVYDWHANVDAMNAVLREKLSDARRFLGYYSSAYSGETNWSEPPATNINGISISAETWATMVLYNGAEGIPVQTTTTHSRGFRSLVQFEPEMGRWIFYGNTRNPNYAADVVAGSVLEEVE